MDPDANLAQIRGIIEHFNWRIDHGKMKGMSQEDFSRLMDLVNLFEGLDGWLSKHGFLPQDWSRR